MSEPQLTFPQEVLYILSSENNDTGLSGERARELTASIMMQLRITLRQKYHRTALPATDHALMVELDLYRDMTAEPRHDWEVTP